MFRLATKFAPRSQDDFQLAWDAGFRHAEFFLDQALIQESRQITERAKGVAMQYAMHCPNRGELSDADLLSMVEMYHRLNCSALVIHQPMFDLHGGQLLALDPELRLGIENHDLGDEAQLTKWAEESPWLTLDVEHLWIYTVQDGTHKQLMACLERFLGKYADKLVHVHLPGYQPGYKVHRPQYCSRKMVRQTFNLLAQFGFEGLVVSETAKKFQNPEELQMDVLLHQHWLKGYEEKQATKDSADSPILGATVRTTDTVSSH